MHAFLAVYFCPLTFAKRLLARAVRAHSPSNRSVVFRAHEVDDIRQVLGRLLVHARATVVCIRHPLYALPTRALCLRMTFEKEYGPIFCTCMRAIRKHKLSEETVRCERRRGTHVSDMRYGLYCMRLP